VTLEGVQAAANVGPIIAPSAGQEHYMRWNLSDRRSEPRFGMERPVWVEVIDGPTLVGKIRDISDHGMGVSIEGPPLRKSDRVRIRFFDQQVAGDIRHSRRNGDLGFDLGVQLDRPFTDAQMDALIAEYVGV
jgi:PilZ domain-containing protein